MAVTGNFNVGNSRSPLLNANEIFATIYNMIISQQVFSDNIKGIYGDLAARFKTDGTLYGDTKLFYATDALESEAWTNKPTALEPKKYTNGNILDTKIPADPKCQYVQIDQFRMIWLSLDNYLSKRAWSTEGAFSQFHAVMTGWMGETKRIYEATLINQYVGNTVSQANKATVNIDVTSAIGDATGEEANRLEASAIAEGIANLLVEMKDISRDFNDYHFLRSYSGDDLLFVWNSKFVNKIKKIDLPTIFHKDGLVDKFEENILPSRYFGRALAESDFGEGKVIGADGAYDSTKGTIRAAREFTYNDVHYFAGDALATTGTYVGVVGGLEVADVYLEVADVICKVIHKSAVPFMSAFETETSFFNPRNLVENKYLIWGYSQPCYLYNYPFITVKKA